MKPVFRIAILCGLALSLFAAGCDKGSTTAAGSTGSEIELLAQLNKGTALPELCHRWYCEKEKATLLFRSSGQYTMLFDVVDPTDPKKLNKLSSGGVWSAYDGRIILKPFDRQVGYSPYQLKENNTILFLESYGASKALEFVKVEDPKESS